MDLVGQTAIDQAEIVTWLTRLDAIDDALTGASATSTAITGSLKQVDEVHFYPVTGEESSSSGSLTLISQGRVLIGRIARALGVSDYLPIGDYFGDRRSPGYLVPLG